MAGGVELGDIVATIGLDSRPLSRGMNNAKRSVKGLADLKRSLEDQFELDAIANKSDRALARLGQKYRDTVRTINRAGFGSTVTNEMLFKAQKAFQVQEEQILRARSTVSSSSAAIAGDIRGMSRRGRQSLTQLAFATDDFIGVYQNSGSVSSALRATSNNIGTLVTMINPLAGIATTVAFAIGSTLLKKFVDTGNAAEVAARKIEHFRDVNEKALRGAVSEVREERRIPGILQGVRGGGDARQARQDSIERAEEQRAQVDAINELIERNRKLASETDDMQVFDTAQEDLKELSRLKDKLLDQLELEGKLQSQLTEIEKERRKAESSRGRKDKQDAIRQRKEEQQQLRDQLLESTMSDEERIRHQAEKDKERIRESVLPGQFQDELLGLADQKRDKRLEELEQKEQEKLARESAKKAERSASIRGDLVSQLFGSDAERRIFDINRQFDETAKTINEVATAADRAELLDLNEQARQKALREARHPAGDSQLASFKQRGSAEAVSAVNRAAIRAQDQKSEEKKLVQESLKQTSHLAQIASALTGGAALAVIDDLGGTG